MLSKSYGVADMAYLAETTGIDEDVVSWDDIPFVEIEAPEAFVSLFQQNACVFDFISEATKRTIINLFLRNIVSLLLCFSFLVVLHIS